MGLVSDKYAADLDDKIDVVFRKFNRLAADEKFLGSPKLNDVLLDAQRKLSEMRRAAVRELRMQGYTLKEIGDLAGGMSPQRVAQIEVGYTRQERRARQARG